MQQVMENHINQQHAKAFRTKGQNLNERHETANVTKRETITGHQTTYTITDLTRKVGGLDAASAVASLVISSACFLLFSCDFASSACTASKSADSERRAAATTSNSRIFCCTCSRSESRSLMVD